MPFTVTVYLVESVKSIRTPSLYHNTVAPSTFKHRSKNPVSRRLTVLFPIGSIIIIIGSVIFIIITCSSGVVLISAFESYLEL